MNSYVIQDMENYIIISIFFTGEKIEVQEVSGREIQMGYGSLIARVQLFLS
jgi:hypothetical protein